MIFKKIHLLSLSFTILISLSFVGSVGASSVMWSQLYEDGLFEGAYVVVETSDGGFAIVGESGLDSDFCLLKIDALGNIEWRQTYGGQEEDYALSVVVTLDGGYAIAGHTKSFGAGDFDFWLVKTDVNGNMQWNQTYGGPTFEQAYSLIQTSDGGYAIAGYTEPSSIKGHDFWLVKTDSNGNMVWNQTYGQKDDELAYSVLETSDGGYVMAGSSWLVKFDSAGTLEWEQTYSGIYARSVVRSSDSGYALFGGGLLIKTDEKGNMLWDQSYTGNGAHGYSNSFVSTSDGGYAFVIGTQLTKIDAHGNIQWTQTYDVTQSTENVLRALTETSDGGYVLVGDTWFMMTGDQSIWAIKTDAYGVIPEFSSLTILPLVLIGALLVAIFRKKF